ncbi:acyl-CoA dehydrogenase C-terminal domain-containing protein, partial [Mycobacterium sp.]|uniref:acyl-CoA dehydrogenase C-terminal domain-containing protein n=1 Tax=Mycobacterium sp. TaxID=1785 RepID=UPI003CA9081C
RELYRVGLESVPFLLAVGDLLIGWLLLRQAEVGLIALDGDPGPADSAFYAGKITTAKFFAKNVLPRLTAEREIAANVDLAVMQLREEAF